MERLTSRIQQMHHPLVCTAYPNEEKEGMVVRPQVFMSKATMLQQWEETYSM